MLDHPKYDKPDMSDECIEYLKEFILQSTSTDHPITRILEFGSGGSTLMFAKLLEPNGHIFSIEHNIDFFDRIKAKIPRNATLQYVINVDDYVTSFINNINLIFIDGIRRTTCMENSINRAPYIMIHDAEREEYIPGFELIANSDYEDISPDNINLKVFYNEDIDSK